MIDGISAVTLGTHGGTLLTLRTGLLPRGEHTEFHCNVSKPT
jgi:hypothetical protein